MFDKEVITNLVKSIENKSDTLTELVCKQREERVIAEKMFHAAVKCLVDGYDFCPFDAPDCSETEADAMEDICGVGKCEECLEYYFRNKCMKEGN